MEGTQENEEAFCLKVFYFFFLFIIIYWWDIKPKTTPHFSARTSPDRCTNVPAGG
jgi:hypothetical protein